MMVWSKFSVNARQWAPRSAKLTRAFLKDEEVSVLPWPAELPDLNPIEHMGYSRKNFEAECQIVN